MSSSNNNVDIYDGKDENSKISKCGWLCMEICGLPMFSLKDPNGKQLDLERCFKFGHIYSAWYISLAKFVLLGICVATYVYGFLEYQYRHWFMSYVSYWTLLETCIYLVFSFGLSLMKQPYMWIINVTWVMLLVVIVKGIVVVLLFWGTEYDWSAGVPPTLFKVASHGISWACAIVDGMIINKTPIRLKHYYFVLAFTLLFLIWTIIQGMIPIDNPWTDDEDNTERLYNILDWQNEPVQATIVSVLVCFVALPLFTTIFWSFSLCYRKYINDPDRIGNNKDSNEPVMSQPDIEVGDAPSKEEEGEDEAGGEEPEGYAQTY